DIFFFQAEDGIRDLTVTGVQTCALPISPPTIVLDGLGRHDRGRRGGQPDPPGGRRSAQGTAQAGGRPARDAALVDPSRKPAEARSEERRVGIECRYWEGRRQ